MGAGGSVLKKGPAPNTLEFPKPKHQRLKRTRDLSLDDFEQGVTLGMGSYGRVRYYEERASSVPWAIKALRKTQVMRLSQEEHVILECDLLKSLRHPFIVHCAGSFQSPAYLYLVLDFVPGGTLGTRLRGEGRLGADACRFYAAQCAVVLEYLHSQKIAYRDLKPDNLLVDLDGHLVLADFGFAKRIADGARSHTFLGTPEYISPEMLGEQGHGLGVDWWALGVLCYEMFDGEPPFTHEQTMELYHLVLRSKVRWSRRVQSHGAIQSFLARLLIKDPDKRAGAHGADEVKLDGFFERLDWRRLMARELSAPWRPPVVDQTDTSMFDAYPDSDEIAPTPCLGVAEDPFADFGSSNISTSLERRKRPSDNVSGSPEWEQRRSSVDSEAMGALAMDPPPLSE